MALLAENLIAASAARPTAKFNGVKVFAATMFAHREQLGEQVTTWIAAHPHREVTDLVVTQSSDDAFHCIAITVFYWEAAARPKRFRFARADILRNYPPE